jgi:hypothetical protein
MLLTVADAGDRWPALPLDVETGPIPEMRNRRVRERTHRLRPTKRCLSEASSLARAGVSLDRSPYSVVPESPNIGSRVPHQLSPRRPRRWRWLRRRPRRRRSPGPPARRTPLAGRTLPVVAAIPVPVVGVAPARVPLIPWAPVIAGRRGRGRLGPGAGAVSRSESGQGQPDTHQHTRGPPNPRSRLPHGRHLPRISFRPESKQE